tara:strand:+ start:96 stop:314 length:219 start_codon:yes stop_codon:yes gene_type:complete
VKKKFIVEVSVDEPLWDMYNKYSCNQMKLKFKDSRKVDNPIIHHDIWIPKTYEEWFNKIKFPKEGKKNDKRV